MTQQKKSGPPCPAPWSLMGRGVIVVLKGSALANASLGYPDELMGGFKSAIKVMMWVDYQHAPCGPYQELLLMPGSVIVSDQRLMSISDIWVSSQRSVDDGRANWGIPKQLGDFEVVENAAVTEEGVAFKVSTVEGESLLEMACQPMGPALPMNTGWIPGKFKGMGQLLDGKEFVFSPAGKGKVRAAKVVEITKSGGVFAGLGRKDVICAFVVSGFEMEFPVPSVREMAA